MPNTQILNVIGPTGPTGDPGATGLTGNQGPQGNPGLTLISSDAGNTATLGSDSLLYVPLPSTPLASTSQNGFLRQVSGLATDFVDGSNHYQNLATALSPTIWSVRSRSYNTLVNANCEVNQRNPTLATLTNPGGGTYACDKWWIEQNGTVRCLLSLSNASTLTVPGTNYTFGSRSPLITVNVVSATLGATDYFCLRQSAEGPRAREVASGVHSLSFYCRYDSSTGGPATGSFTVTIRIGGTWSLLLPFTLSSGVNTLVQFPNLPAFPAALSTTPGASAYSIDITLASGTTYTSSTVNSWLSGNFLAGSAQMNLFATGSVPTGWPDFYFYYMQHEPGPERTSLIDVPFDDSLRLCQRYYSKSNSYGNPTPTSNDWREVGTYSNTTTCRCMLIFPVDMALAPTITLYDNGINPGAVYLEYIGSTGAVVQTGFAYNSRSLGEIDFSPAATASSVGAAVLLQWSADCGGSV